MAVNTLAYEQDFQRRGFAVVAGLDEAGRGPLAGPVIAACVVLPSGCRVGRFLDSKVLSPAARLEVRDELERIGAQVGIGSVSAAEIDRYNILRASLLAMKKAVEAMPCNPDALLVDGKFPIPAAILQKALIKGESKSASIAAASVVAKVFRDALMERYHLEFPGYNFHKNKGYPTLEHRQALARIGPCSIHRKTFKGVCDLEAGRGQPHEQFTIPFG